ncbi:MAG TPA: MFS transporter [Streptosporangiaceae bacterium]|nr:MFS transporter [Streptosporangiaceae bacterium]
MAVALAVELADELVDGAKGAALPLIRHDLGLSYEQVGLLASVPLLAGGALELPLGIVATGPARRRAVLAGGIIFILSLLAVAGARSFLVLLAAFTVFFPASGAFVSLTQAELMDAWPDRQAQVMARWDLAGSTGAVAGPLLLTAVLAAGGGWRAAYLALAAAAAVAWLGTCLRDPVPAAAPDATDAPDAVGFWARVREVLGALRDWSTVRWVLLIEVADLLVDVLTGFLALYLVDVAHLPPAVAALAIAIRLGAGLAGDAALMLVLERVADVTVLRACAAAAALLYPGFLLAPGPVAKLVILAVLSAATAPWYPILQARLYGSLPGRSSVAVTLSSAAALAGGLGPLTVGLIAQAFGLSWALAVLVVVPVAVLAGSAGAGGAGIGPRGGDRAGGAGNSCAGDALAASDDFALD